MPTKAVNTESFTKLIRKGSYVDKTGFFEQFLDDEPDAALFTRPRRFGKTIFMSMLAEFFDITKDSKNLFAGLKVSANKNLCDEWMNQYPVVFLTFKIINKKSWVISLQSIRRLVGNTFDLYRHVLESNKISPRDKRIFKSYLDDEYGEGELAEALYFLTKVLCYHYGKPAIVLIDEYDAPIAASVEHEYYEEMIQFMRYFLGDVLKGNPYLKLGILTGVLRIAKESYFSDINNLQCDDIATNGYEDIFGFTQEEVDSLLERSGAMEKRELIKEWYDGYHIGKRSDMYCPWSISQYLIALRKNPEKTPEEYWVDTASNHPSRELASKMSHGQIQDYMTALLDGKTIPVTINTKLSYDKVFQKADNFWTLLYLTGYLTLSGDRQNCVEEPGQRTVLCIPNKEIRKVFESEITSWFSNILTDDCREDFLDKFWKGDAKGLQVLLDERMKISTSIQEYAYKEFFYQTLLKGFFLLRYNVSANKHAGEGIFDLMVDNGKDIAAVIEIKRADSERQLDAKVQEALAQIAARSYDEPLRAKKFPKILHWGMAFHKRTCKMGVKIV